MIQTSYLARTKRMPAEDAARCKVISRYMPPRMRAHMPHLHQLAPSAEMLESLHRHLISQEKFTKEYIGILDMWGVDYVKELIGEDSILLCYEAPATFCHRHILADWLNKHGIECEEYNPARLK